MQDAAGALAVHMGGPRARCPDLLLVVIVVLLALAATLAPARRASHVRSVDALRYQDVRTFVLRSLAVDGQSAPSIDESDG